MIVPIPNKIRTGNSSYFRMNTINNREYYSILVHRGNHKEILKWIEDTYGEPGVIYLGNLPDATEVHPRWCNLFNWFYFRDEPDLIMFMLRWS